MAVARSGSLTNHALPLTSVDGAFTPIRMMDIELGRPLPDLSSGGPESGVVYSRAWLLARLHGIPVGIVEIDLEPEGLGREGYLPKLQEALLARVNTHLAGDGLPGITDLGELEQAEVLQPCIRERDEFLKKAPFVTLVICTRDRAESLGVALQSVAHLNYPRFEVIVVDNASKNGATKETVERMQASLPQLRYEREDRPGVSWARNRGLRLAKGEFIAYTDDDVTVDENWLAEIIKGFFVAEDVSCVTGLTLPAEIESQPQMWFEELGGFTFGFERQLHSLRKAPLPHPLYPFSAIKFGTGVNIAFRTSVLRSLRGFDPAFPNGQDIETYFRVLKTGGTMVYEPRALVRHFHRRDYSALQRQIYNYGIAFTAFLFKTAIHDPAMALSIIRKLPYGLYSTLNPRAPRFAKKQADFPKELAQLERHGMALGPIKYVQHRMEVWNTLRRFGEPGYLAIVGKAPRKRNR